MELDLELYRREVRVTSDPLVRLSAIDIAPAHAQQTLIFLHGFGGQATQWRYQIGHFAVANRVIALDLRGHGRSDKPASAYDMEQIQADLEQALALLEVAPGYVLVGHSFGGAVATEYAVAHPHQIAQLVLIATAGEFHLSRLFRFILNLPTQLLRLFQPYTSQWLFAPPHVLQAWHQHNLASWNGWSLFRSLTVPTLVIRGHWDLLFAAPHFEEVANAIPHVEELDVGSSKHMVMLERQDAVNRGIARFIAGEIRRSWRQPVHDDVVPEQLNLRQHRPWLTHYDANIPHTIAVPPICVPDLLRSAVRRFPRRTALWFEGARISYTQLNRIVNRLAAALCDLGLVPQQRVMVLLPNLPQAVIAFYGILKAGGVVVLAPLELGPGELARIVEATEAKLVIAWRDLPQLPDLVALVPSHTQVMVARTSTYLPWWKRVRMPHPPILPGTLEFSAQLRNQPESSPVVDSASTNVALIQYTSGTTDAPKGVMLTHRNLVANTVQTRHWMPEAHEGKERFLCVLPLSHIYAVTTALNLPIAVGATLYLKPRFDALDLLKTIKRQRPTIFPGVPAMYMAIKDFPNVRRYGIDSVKACLSGAAPLPLEVQEAFEKLTRGRLVEGYGLTEAGPVTHGTPLHGIRKAGSIGIPLPSTEARVVHMADRTQVLADGVLGELAVRGPQVMAGYWRDHAATQRALDADGWLLTGDIVQMDGDGYFHMIARKVDMWYPSALDTPAFPRDIEEVLFEIPQVREAAVVAIANHPVAFVIADPNSVRADAILTYCGRRLAPELVPQYVIFVESLPRSFVGKVLRRKLAMLASQPQMSDATG